MSQGAGTVRRQGIARHPSMIAPAPVRRPAPRPALGPRALAPPRVRRGSIAFVVFSALVLGLMVLGLVALNALMAQSSFKIDSLSARVDGLTLRHQLLTLEAARLSAPQKIAEQARARGMGLPVGGIQILHVRAGTGRAAARARAPKRDGGAASHQRGPRKGHRPHLPEAVVGGRR